MMKTAIINFPKQFTFQPKIANGAKLKKYKKFAAMGMGGSLHSVDIIKAWKPELDIISHRDYGLPAMPNADFSGRLFIVCSYSGNTEETLDGFEAALRLKLPVAVISKGGKLLEAARRRRIPYVQIPDTHIQPRCSLGFLSRAFMKLMGLEDGIEENAKLATLLDVEKSRKKGLALSKRLKNYVPVLYASRVNFPVVYNWKIKLNETGKIPAFYNVFPELNHNEINGFDVQKSTKDLCQSFYFIFFKDSGDHPRVQKRMDITKKIYESRGLPVEVLKLEGKNKLHKIFNSLVLADWTAYYTAENYGLESEQVPMVEEFKALIK